MQEINNERDWTSLVSQVIKKNPDWVSATNEGINSGILLRLKQEQEKRADAEVALSMTFDAARNVLPPLNLEQCKKVLKNSYMFGGTEYVKNL